MMKMYTIYTTTREEPGVPATTIFTTVFTKERAQEIAEERRRIHPDCITTIKTPTEEKTITNL